MSSYAQQLAPNTPGLITSYPFFNADFIKIKSIKKISTVVMYKSPNRKLRTSSEQAIFDFEPTGHVTKWQNTNRSGYTTTTSFYRAKNGLLATEHITNSKKSVLKSYVYDEHNHVTKIQLSDAHTAKTLLEERFSYEYFTSIQYKKYWLNDEGLTYKHTVVDLDNEGHIIEERTRYIRGASKETNYYKYQDGLLTTYSNNIKEQTRRETKYQMEYTKTGNFLVMEEFKDGARINRYEYLYEEGLLIAILRKNIKTQQIKITKIKYQY
jgi:hypothetical protein